MAPYGIIDGRMQLAAWLLHQPSATTPRGTPAHRPPPPDAAPLCPAFPEASATPLVAQLPHGAATISLWDLEALVRAINVFLERHSLGEVPILVENALFTTPFGTPPRAAVAPVAAAPRDAAAAALPVLAPLVRRWQASPTLPIVPSRLNISRAGARTFVTVRRQPRRAGVLAAGAAVAAAATAPAALRWAPHSPAAQVAFAASFFAFVALSVAWGVPLLIGRPPDTLTLTRTRWEWSPMDWTPDNALAKLLDWLWHGGRSRGEGELPDRLRDLRGAKVRAFCCAGGNVRDVLLGVSDHMPSLFLTKCLCCSCCSGPDAKVRSCDRERV